MSAIDKITIIFVYNANGGLFNGVVDYIHKFVSPTTYECNLCAITYDNLGMKKQWKYYVNSLKFPTLFLHKDEFNKKFPEYSESTLPAIFTETKGRLIELLSSHELNSLSTQEMLIETMKKKLIERVFT